MPHRKFIKSAWANVTIIMARMFVCRYSLIYVTGKHQNLPPHPTFFRLPKIKQGSTDYQVSSFPLLFSYISVSEQFCICTDFYRSQGCISQDNPSYHKLAFLSQYTYKAVNQPLFQDMHLLPYKMSLVGGESSLLQGLNYPHAQKLRKLHDYCFL